MSKQLKQILSFLTVLIIVAASLSYGVVMGAKSERLEQTITEQEREIEVLNVNLKTYSSLVLEKESYIQQLAAQNEGLTWQLQEDNQ